MEEKFQELVAMINEEKVNDYLIHLLEIEENQELVSVSRRLKN